MENIKPIEEGNAQSISESCLPITPLVLLRYEAIADFYSEEPRNISVKLHESDKSNLFEQIFRLRVWVPNQAIDSWIIYCNSRDWLDPEVEVKGLIIRHVIWERSEDIVRVRTTHKNNKGKLLDRWPQIKARNIYLNPQLSVQLIKILSEGDKILSKGITLAKRSLKKNRPDWRNLEIRRVFNWGNVQALWDPSMENKELETYCLVLSDHLKAISNQNLESVYELELDFGYPPEDYKSLLSGRKLSQD